MSASLTAVSVPDDAALLPRRVELNRERVMLGRSRLHCDVPLVLQAKVFSRQHASLVRDYAPRDGAQGEAPELWFVRDEGSRSGTFVNGHKIALGEPVLLRDGDLISFGPAWSTGGKLKYEFRSAPLEEEDTDAEEEVGKEAGIEASQTQDAKCLEGIDQHEQQQQQQQLAQSPYERACDRLPCTDRSADAEADNMPSLQKQAERLVLDPESDTAERGQEATAAAPSGCRNRGCGPSAAGCAPIKSSSSSSSCSSSSSSRFCGVKRDRSQCCAAEDSCAFSSLIRIVKMHAKKLCQSAGCKDKNKFLAAASAACEAMEKAAGSVKSLDDNDLVGASKDADEVPAAAAATASEAAETAVITAAAAAAAAGKSTGVATAGGETGGDAMSMPSTPCSPCPGSTTPLACIPLEDQNGMNCVPIDAVQQDARCRATSAPAAALLGQPGDQEVLSRRLSEIRSELTCPICQDVFLSTNTFECGHSFCEPCAATWLSKQLSCPICRRSVDKPPVRSRTVDKAVEVTLKSNHPSAWEGLEQRQRTYEAELQKDLETKLKLEEAVEKAQRKGLKCVNIARPWTERERCRFLKGLKCYRGPPREAYCSSVCLTPCFVQRASLKDLAVAASNVRLGCAKEGLACDQMDAVQLRNRLHMFIKYC